MKADINIKDNDGFTPFHYICQNMLNIDILRYCYKFMKADINIKNNRGSTPFHYICYYGNSNGFDMKILKYCCKVMKANINNIHNNGTTPFYYLCKLKNNHNVLKYLSKNNLLTDETIKNSKLTTMDKLKYFTEGILISLDWRSEECDLDYVLY